MGKRVREHRGHKKRTARVRAARSRDRGRKPSPRPKQPGITVMLAAYSGEVRKMVMRLRKIVRTTLPESTETITPNNKFIRYSIDDGEERHYCIYIQPADRDIRLGIDTGKLLSGAHALDAPSGNRIRHLTIPTDGAIPVKAVQSLLVEAAIHLLLRKALTAGT